jgi:hypothetical protein
VERDLIAERTKEGLAAAKAKGKQLGRPKGVLGTQNRHTVGLTLLESTGNELIAIPMKRYILRAFTRLALVWTLRRPATMLFRSFLTLRNSQSRQIEQYLSNLRRVLRSRSAMGKTRKLLCNKTLMVKGVGFEALDILSLSIPNAQGGGRQLARHSHSLRNHQAEICLQPCHTTSPGPRTQLCPPLLM